MQGSPAVQSFPPPRNDPAGQPGINTWTGRSNGKEWTIHQGSALDVLKKLKSGFVDCIVTSPPYFWLRAVDKSGGMGIGLQRKSLIGIPGRVALALAEDEWVLRSAIIWHRKNRLPESVRDRPCRSYEHVFMLAKSRRYHFAKAKSKLLGGEIDEDLWTIPVQPRPNGGLDTAPFPDELVERCLGIGCPAGGVVLDPFVGSGTTVRVAVSTERSGIGIDLNEEFCRHAVQVLDQML